MFWALISPLRHTAEPPRLSPTSPLRVFFQRHGGTVARHPVLSIVISVVIAVMLCYPFPFLYSPTATHLPSNSHHVWTSARPFSNTRSVPDIEIRQAWIQGSFMGALVPEVMEEALKVQETLLGSGTDCVSYADEGPISSLMYDNQGSGHRSLLATPGMFFHSPLLYWNCSIKAIKNDPDLLDTINKNYYRHSPANVTLRWGSVFAGKRFSHHRLVEADALVISLFYRLDGPMGGLWDERAAALAENAQNHKRYDVYPSDGKEKHTTLYEFRFQPMSTLDNLLLASCYLFTLAYLAVSLRRLRAVKSRLGLVLTVLTQIAASIISSFTILAFMGVPVSHIPREAFPFVVLVIGLENMFRLINAVLDTPAEQPTTTRIAIALGEVGFLSTVAVATDLAILCIIGHFSVPAVREFCTFAAVALVMDFILHLTYFLAVLSVDVRRLELQDSLDRLNLSSDDIKKWQKNNDYSAEKQNKLTDFLLHGAMPVSTRIAGSAIMICFLVALNMHFLENQSPLRTINDLVDIISNPRMPHKRSLTRTPSMPVNVARTPTSWLKLQDQLTGMELIRAVKPGAHRVIAKVYDPLFVVLKGSNRAKFSGGSRQFSGVFDVDLIKDHLQAFVLTIVVVIAGVTILMNHLLMKSMPDDTSDTSESEKPLVTAETLFEGHSLDVAMLTASPRGVVVSVGLDRRIVVWKLKTRWQNPSKDILRPTCSEHVLWPVMAIALDERGELLAVVTRTGMVSFWQVKEAIFCRSVSIELNRHHPSAFFFEPRSHDDPQHGPRLVVLRQDGWLFEIGVWTGGITHHRICNGVVVSSSHGVFTPRLPLRIVTACQRGRIFVTAKIAGTGEWRTDQLTFFNNPSLEENIVTGEPCTILPLSALGMIVSSRSCSVDLVDLLSGGIIRTFQTGQFKPNSLRAFHAKRRTCLYCGCPSVLSFSIAYSESDSGMFIMHTFYSARGKMRDICLRVERDRRERKCSGFESVVETMHWLENVEGWEPTNLNMVAGIRRREFSQEDQSSDDQASPSSSLRRRGKPSKKQSSEDEDEWESWTMHADGVVTTYPLHDKNTDTSDDGLLVSRAGPVCRVGQRSVAVGFGNTVKVISVGNERYEDDDDDYLYNRLPRGKKNHYHRMR